MPSRSPRAELAGAHRHRPSPTSRSGCAPIPTDPDGPSACRCPPGTLPAAAPPPASVTEPGGSFGLYTRVPDLVALARAVLPVLDRRLAASPAQGWTGTLIVDCYVDGLRLVVADGRVEAVEPWRAAFGTDEGQAADVALPRDAFVHLLLGNRSLAQVEAEVADCEVLTDTGALVLDALFPVMALSSWPFA